MSNNIFKANYIQVSSDNVRVIDNSNLMARKYEEYSNGRNTIFEQATEEEAVEESDGFSPIDLTGLVTDFEASEANVVSQLPQDVEKRCTDMLEKAKSDAQEEADRIIEEAMARAEDIKEEARKAGVKDGYREGSERAEAEKTIALEANANRRRELEEEYEKLFNEFEPGLVRVITDIYRKIFGEGLYDYSQVIIHVINKAMRGVEGDGNIVLYVSAEDYDFVLENQSEILDKVPVNGNFDIKILAELISGNAKIETSHGILDCGIDTQLKELTGKLTLLSFEAE